ncbi:isoleucyl-trna synthetase [Stylonychia lemnae]|uniref:isoleucine--tRNA ligase n=1 Tax=Stylonychia lemnae TaxID=5949 RepID=A0A078B0V9_STYLE|nr:isoleucyl-trna synthetase [Stylonychia lemnae]|eukprot:CDW87946.1 isoleucyl-trna synthetase [Stylonychia lemnae]
MSILKSNRLATQNRYQSLLTWELYNWQLVNRQGHKVWSIHDGPPFASGKPHLGHLYNKTLKDIINRYQLLQGYQVNFISGFDCYGTIIEDIALSDKSDQLIDSLSLSINNNKIDEFNFSTPEEKQILKNRQKCKEFVRSSILSHMEQYQKWGIMCDLRQSYFTMNQFGKLVQQRQIYRGGRTVFWSIDQQRIMDEHQVEEISEIRDCVIAKFPINSFGKQSDQIRQMYPEAKFLVFSTEPWKLMGTHAIAVNDGISYALCSYKDEYLIMAEKRIAEMQIRAGKEQIKTLLIFTGQQLSDIVLGHPLVNNKEIPVVIYNNVRSSFGTGINIVAPGHDIESLKISQVKLHILNLSAIWITQRRRMLKEQNSLFQTYKYQNTSYINNETKERIVLITLDSWFMSVPEKLSMMSLQELAALKYIPPLNLKTSEEAHQDYIKIQNKALKSKQDFGSYYINIVEEINQILIDQEIIQHVSKVFLNNGGSDAWYSLPISELLPRRYKHRADKLAKGQQVFDVWFDNALSWNFVKDQTTYKSFITQFEQSGPQLSGQNTQFNQITQDLETNILEDNQEQKPKKLKVSLKDYMNKKKLLNNQQSYVGKSNAFIPQNEDNLMQLRQLEYNFQNSLQNDLTNKLNQQSLDKLRLFDHIPSIQTSLVMQQNLFPYSMFLEGFDQHSRWFMSSFILSMSLTGESPFNILKTHGLIVDEQGEKLSKSDGAQAGGDPDDLIEGSIKLDGTRKYGYGIDVIRAWCAFKDSDKNLLVQKDHLDQINKEVKVFRDIIRVLCQNVKNLDINKDIYDFNKLGFIDKMMMIKLLKFSQEITDNFDNFDLKNVYEKTINFLLTDVIGFYLEFVKHKKYLDDVQNKQVMFKILNSLLLTTAPILCFSAQEAFDDMPNNLFEDYEKPQTIFQLPWFLEEIVKSVGQKFLAQFQNRDLFDKLLNMRKSLREVYEEHILKMVSKGDYQKTKMHILVTSLDCNEATLLEILGDDLDDFFFGVQVVIQTEVENLQMKEAPLKTLKHSFTFKDDQTEEDEKKQKPKPIQYEYRIRVYRNNLMKCGMCKKAKIKNNNPKDNEIPIDEGQIQLCGNCQKIATITQQ